MFKFVNVIYFQLLNDNWVTGAPCKLDISLNSMPNLAMDTRSHEFFEMCGDRIARSNDDDIIVYNRWTLEEQHVITIASPIIEYANFSSSIFMIEFCFIFNSTRSVSEKNFRWYKGLILPTH